MESRQQNVTELKTSIETEAKKKDNKEQQKTCVVEKVEQKYLNT